MLEKYKTTMDNKELHLWARDAQNKIEVISDKFSLLLNVLETTYRQSPEGRDYISRAREDLSL